MEFQFLLLAFLILQTISTVVVIFVVKNFFRQLMIGMGSKTVPSIFSQKSSPSFFKEEKNEIPEQNPDEIEFSEDNPLNIPSDVKFEIEGGESFAPPGFSVQPGVNNG